MSLSAKHVAKMRYFCLFICAIHVVSLVSTRIPTKSEFKLFGPMGDMLSLKSLANLVNSIKDLFTLTNTESNNINFSLPVSEDAELTITELAKKYGYVMEEHNVTTEDGYVLKMHRIPYGRDGINKNKVVFLMHGLIDSSDSWVLQGPNNSLAYILADEGYDVWMGNARGNKHSSSHIRLTTDMARFWKFTWEEIGIFDLPAMIDYILAWAKKKHLYYVGHSQGTTVFYVLASMKPEYNDKIKMMFSMSPVAYMYHVKSPLVRMFSPANKLLAAWLSNLNTYSPSTEFFNKLFSVICFVVARCDNMLNIIVGNNYNLVDQSLLPVVFSHMPSGSSTLQFVHYGQLVHSGRFARFDFGNETNMEVYKQETPPKYDLSKITVPVVLFCSRNDWLSDLIDVIMLKSELPYVRSEYLLYEFNHLDFMYASLAKSVIYDNIVEEIGHDR